MEDSTGVATTKVLSTKDFELEGVKIADVPRCFIATAGHTEYVYQTTTLADVGLCLAACQGENQGHVSGGCGLLQLGCWTDSATRALAGGFVNLKGAADALEQCEKAAVAAGNAVFALQDGGQCFANDPDGEKNYNKQGKITISKVTVTTLRNNIS